MVACNPIEAEYRSMASTCYEVIWLKFLLTDFCFDHKGAIKLYCNNQSTIHLCKNLVVHERTKDIEMDYHFIQDKVMQGRIELVCVHTSSQIAYCLLKPCNHDNVIT